jgi:hypothetical protein
MREQKLQWGEVMVVPICEVTGFEVEPWSGFFSVCLREGRTSCSAIDMVEEDELKITGGRREIWMLW